MMHIVGIKIAFKIIVVTKYELVFFPFIDLKIINKKNTPLNYEYIILRKNLNARNIYLKKSYLPLSIN